MSRVERVRRVGFAIRHSSFVIDSSFGFRISGFVHMTIEENAKEVL
jgi:hypothetical protein